MEPVTHRENTLRGIGPAAISAKKTHCARGHLFDEVNTCRLSRGGRGCRTCGNERSAECRERRRLRLR
jgi:hypothetical protein